MKVVMLRNDAEGFDMDPTAGQALSIGVFFETADCIYPKWIQDAATGNSCWFSYE